MASSVLRTFVLRDDMSAQSLWAFLKNNWRELAGQGKPLAVTVQQHKVKRSTDQNRRYWAILNEISEMAWINGRQFSTDAWHEFFRKRFIGCEETPDGQMIGISSSSLDVAAFADYMTKVEQYAAAELGVELL